jgi:hypothetical protein
MRSARLGAWVAALLLVLARPAVAHDLWIEPTTFTPEPGQPVGVRLRVGVDLIGDPLARDAALIDRFVWVEAAQSRDIPGRQRGDPAGIARARSAGLAVIGYHSRPSRVELPTEKFDDYLREEGLDQVLASRQASAGGARAGTRELFFRCAKSLLRVGASGSAGGDRVLGFPLELVAERDPYASPESEELPVRLVYEGQPLAGALVVAINRSAGLQRVSARTDAAGRVRLGLRGGGMWLVKAVHMVAAPPGADADWSSYWASLTFER